MDFRDDRIPLVWHAVRINLTEENLKVVTFPSSSSAETSPNNGITVAEYANKTKATVAINTFPFSIRYSFPHLIRAPIGLCVDHGKILSPAIDRYCALTIGKAANGVGLHAVIYDSQSDIPQNPLPDYAFGGYWTIFRNNTIFEFANRKTARSAAGTAAKGTILLLLIVEGNTKKTSSGLSFMECARILKELGADTAMEFDGGSSTDLVVKGKSLLSFPSNKKVAGCLGFISE